MSFRRLKNVGFANLEDTLHSFLKTSRLVLHKTFGENVSETSCKTDFNTFLKSGLKVILKLSSQAWCITHMSFLY